MNGDLQEEVYMSLPEGFNAESGQDIVCKLNKSLFGLKQAPRCWNAKFNSVLKTFGLSQTDADPCVFTGYVNGEKVKLILYVDDGLIMSQNLTAIDNVLHELV